MLVEMSEIFVVWRGVSVCLSLLQGAFWGLMVGLSVGVVRMILDFVYPEPGCGEADDRPLVVARIHYMYFALMLCVLTGITVVTISYAGKRPDPSKVWIYTLYHKLLIEGAETVQVTPLRRTLTSSP